MSETEKVALDWFGTPIKQAIVSVFQGMNTAVEALDLFKKYRRRQFRSLKASLGNIKILGMSKPIPLTRIYHPTFISTTIHRRLFKEDWQKVKDGPGTPTSPVKDSDAPVLRADQYIDRNQRVVVLGGPGSGKTTLLRYTALAFSDKEIFEESNFTKSMFPIFISLLEFSQKSDCVQDMFSYIVADLKSRTDDNAEYFLKRVLDRGAAIVLLDGLDEVPIKQRVQITRCINDLVKRFPEAKFVLSCRTADYREVFENFYEVEVVRLTDRAVKKIIHGWFHENKQKGLALIKRIEHDPVVRQLTETPLLLSLICIQYNHELSLPKRKAELYQRCIDAFIREWDASRGFRRETVYENLSDDRKERLFEEVAGHYTEDDIQLTFNEPELTRIIEACCELYGIERKEAKGVLSEIEKHHGILERTSATSFAFSHTSFQEYYAARYIFAKRSEMEYLKTYFDDTKWNSIIEFIVSIHPYPDEIVRFLVHESRTRGLKNYPAIAKRLHRLHLLYKCLSTGAALTPSVRKAAYEHLAVAQVDLSAIFRDGGVYPIAALMANGVRHAYLYSHKRKTLYQALQPFRVLSNEILHCPSEEYASAVFNLLGQRQEKKPGEMSLSEIAVMLCLIVPLASQRPNDVLANLEKMRAAAGRDSNSVLSLVSESIDNLKAQLTDGSNQAMQPTGSAGG